jgi:hypothetical protein
MPAPDNIDRLHEGEEVLNTVCAIISEAALTVVEATGQFGTLMKIDDVESLAVRLSFVHPVYDWFKRDYGREPNHAQSAQLRQWLELARAQEARRGKAPE